MPMRFTDLARATKTGKLDLGGGDVIRFEFRHGLITPHFMHTLLALDESRLKGATADEGEAAVMNVCEQVARLIVEWDLLDEDGSMFPLDVERLARDIPLTVQIGLLQQCLEEMGAGEASAPGDSASKPTSGATSSRTARSGRSRRGIRS